MTDPFYQGFPSQMAFYMVLSIVPIVILLSQLLGVFGISLSLLDGTIDKYVSAEVSDMLKNLLSYHPAGGSNIIMVVTALWAASKAQMPMMRMSNYAFSDGKYISKGPIKERINSIISMILILATIAFTMIVLVYGQMILTLALGPIIEGSYITTVWEYLRWPITIVLYFCMVFVNYYFLPAEKQKVKDIIPGSLLCSVGMVAATIGYSIYTGNAGKYDLLYGSLATIVAFLFWLYFLSYIMHLGVIFNKVWIDSRAISEEGMQEIKNNSNDMHTNKIQEEIKEDQ